RLHRPGVPGGAAGERPGASPDPAPLPRGEWGNRAGLSDAAGSPGGGGTEEPAGGGEGAGPDRALVQRGAVAQRLGVSAAGGLLPGQPGGTEGGAAAEAGPGAAPEAAEEPGLGARDATVWPGGGRGFPMRPGCAIAGETIQSDVLGCVTFHAV